MATKSPDITLYFLGASRAIRIAWLLEELSLPYKLEASPRASNGLAPPEFKAKIPTMLGKSPAITDGDLVIQESGAVAEYLCETYDAEARLLPREPKARAKVREFMAAAEGTFMLHALAILYARWRLPKPAAEYLPEMEASLSPNVQNDLDWLEDELSTNGSQGSSGAGGEGGEKKFLVGDDLTAADIIMGFSIEFILSMKLGTKGGSGWPRVHKWLDRIRESPSYRKAVEKTGYSL